MGRVEWDNEHHAARVLTSVLGGAARQRDGVAGEHRDSTHDFDLALSDGTVIAVEVTQATKRDAQQQLTERSKRNWDFPELDSQWSVTIREPGTRIGHLHVSIAAILQQLDGVGIEIYRATDERLSATFHQQVARAGVLQIARFGPATGRNVLINGQSRGGAYDANSVSDIVQDHVNRDDNALKLSLATADRRHLFIWVTIDMGGAVAAMADSSMPSEHPDLPDSIDEVWVATALKQSRIWHYSRSGWRVVD